MPFTVALVGRPNVGKSTLFNRLVGKRLALTDDTPGVTRDRREGEARLADLEFSIVDTAGYQDGKVDDLEMRMREQTQIAVEEADLALLMIDAKTGPNPADESFAALLRKTGKPILLVANKSESRSAQAGLAEAHALGLGEPVAISAEHGAGMAELRDALVEYAEKAGETITGDEMKGGDDLPDESEDDADWENKPIRVAVIGRPNAGKSTLINRLIGQERLLTGPEAGITRDSISVSWNFQGRDLKLFDTAGLRRKARVQGKLEKLSVADALRAIRFAEVVILVLDSLVPFEKQDLQIADLVIREGRALVIGFNKWDQVEDRSAMLTDLHAATQRLLPQIRGVRAVPISAVTGDNLDSLLNAVIATYDIWNTRIPTAGLNKWLENVQQRHPAPAISGRRVRLKFITQVKARPPSFMVACSRPQALNASYTRYLVNGLRQTFGLDGVPIRLSYRKPDNPYV